MSVAGDCYRFLQNLGEVLEEFSGYRRYRPTTREMMSLGAFGDEPSNPVETVQAVPTTPSAVVVVSQWGLRLPNGAIMWEKWKDFGFTHPMDRMRLVAILQKTAVEAGFEPDEFLSHYGWVTRNAVYEDTGAYSLTDSRASSTGTPSGEQDHVSNQSRLDGGLHSGPVGDHAG